MRQKAQLLLDEAATWSLLWYLYGKGNKSLTTKIFSAKVDVLEHKDFLLLFLDELLIC